MCLHLLRLLLPLGDGVPVLPSRPLTTAPVVVPEEPFINFDLEDARAEQASTPPSDAPQPHSIFRLRRHWGLAGGYDRGVVHGSLGVYITVAELGRWNLGTTSPAIGWSRYSRYDARSRTTVATTEMTVLMSLASVHYRVGYMKSLRQYWYVNFEQVFDMRANINGSQIGISISGP